MKKIAGFIKIIIFSLFTAIFGLLLICLPSKKYSNWERRSLTQKPAFSAQTLSSGKFMSDFDAFTLDQFPLRDDFRRLKAYSSKYIFLNKDNNGLYQKDAYLSKLEYPWNQNKINKNFAAMNQIYKSCLESSDCKIYYSIIPDKNYFLKPDLLIPFSDFESAAAEKLNFAEYISINNLITLENFYKTDQHWKQETLLPVAHALAEGMNVNLNQKFTENLLPYDFYGAYYGQSALCSKPEKITYLTNQFTESAIVTSYNTGTAKPSSMYSMQKASGLDPYEMFLSGSDALLTIENPDSESSRELIIFRDSFASSLTPLLASGYNKITLVDLRYIKPELLQNYIEFNNQDVLFLYSTLILNGV